MKFECRRRSSDGDSCSCNNSCRNRHRQPAGRSNNTQHQQRVSRSYLYSRVKRFSRLKHCNDRHHSSCSDGDTWRGNFVPCSRARSTLKRCQPQKTPHLPHFFSLLSEVSEVCFLQLISEKSRKSMEKSEVCEVCEVCEVVSGMGGVYRVFSLSMSLSSQ